MIARNRIHVPLDVQDLTEALGIPPTVQVLGMQLRDGGFTVELVLAHPIFPGVAECSAPPRVEREQVKHLLTPHPASEHFDG